MSNNFTLFWALVLAALYVMTTVKGDSSSNNTMVVMNDDQRLDFLMDCVESKRQHYPFLSKNSTESDCCLSLARNYLYNQVMNEFEKVSNNATHLYYPSVPWQIANTLKVCHGIIDSHDWKQKQNLQSNFSELFKETQPWRMSSLETLRNQEGMGNFPTLIFDWCEGNSKCISNSMKLCASHIIFEHILDTQHNKNNYEMGKKTVNDYYQRVINSWGNLKE
ncbi:hypothetical protein FDP41_002109 [Naegleria fowleri]|uniref:Uncharacterized protein n=1 Tax=Naegleria fowleri TaxID=5763 RepID=A0A6A5C1F6_NAEFO|nr:uncharacterized protein FDP41_002109 [Naegleria fowleri]KAF0979039.1 hypothetical protein FDP41_002109 [Naegleria fowleri]CAG4718168.1 unnamed protein product [Naegleria fowleri]